VRATYSFSTVTVSPDKPDEGVGVGVIVVVGVIVGVPVGVGVGVIVGVGVGVRVGDIEEKLFSSMVSISKAYPPI